MRRPGDILDDVKSLAIEYYRATGKPLGVTGEIAEFEAARVLGLRLAEARFAGADAYRDTDGRTVTIQIKGRWKRDGKKWGRVPSIKTGLDHSFDVAMLVLLRGDYELYEVWEMPREKVIALLDKPGSRARNERRSMAVAQFIASADRVWPREACDQTREALIAQQGKTGDMTC